MGRHCNSSWMATPGPKPTSRTLSSARMLSSSMTCAAASRFARAMITPPNRPRMPVGRPNMRIRRLAPPSHGFFISNKATKYVLTRNLDRFDWENSQHIGGDVVDGVRRLKASDGPALHIWGSSELLQTLERDDFSSNRHPALPLCLSMSFFAKPVPTFAGHALAYRRRAVFCTENRLLIDRCGSPVVFYHTPCCQ